MTTAFMVLLIVITNAAGDVLLTRGMKQVGEVSTLQAIQLLRIGKRVVSNPSFLLGLSSLALSFVSFLTVLSWADMSFIVPATALVYVVSLLGAKFILKEEVHPMRWAGTFLVCLGVAMSCVP